MLRACPRTNPTSPSPLSQHQVLPRARSRAQASGQLGSPRWEAACGKGKGSIHHFPHLCYSSPHRTHHETSTSGHAACETRRMLVEMPSKDIPSATRLSPQPGCRSPAPQAWPQRSSMWLPRVLGWWRALRPHCRDKIQSRGGLQEGFTRR